MLTKHILLYSHVLFRYVERDAAQSSVSVLDVAEKSHGHVHDCDGGHAGVEHTSSATERRRSFHVILQRQNLK